MQAQVAARAAATCRPTGTSTRRWGSAGSRSTRPTARCERVNYRVEAARLGRTTDYERLVLEVWTNGTLSPEQAVSRAAMLLRDHLGIFISAEESIRESARESEQGLDASMESLLSKDIDELELSVRSVNSLKNANIHTLRDLVRKSEKDMLETKNFGKKSLEEVQEVLEGLGLQLGMDVPERSAAAV